MKKQSGFTKHTWLSPPEISLKEILLQNSGPTEAGSLPIESLIEIIQYYKKELNGIKEELHKARIADNGTIEPYRIRCDEVCELLKISARTLKKWQKNGLIPFVKIGKYTFYNPDDLEQKLEQNYIRKPQG